MASSLGSVLSLRFHPLPHSSPLRTGRGNVCGSGDEYDASVGWRVQWLRCLLQLGELDETLPAGDFLVSMHVLFGIFTKDNVGAKVSSSHGNNNEERGVISVGRACNSMNGRFDNNTGMPTVRMTVDGQIICVDISTSDGENCSEKNEKTMKGRRGFVSTIAASSFICSMGLIPYWNFCCLNTPPSISGTWMDVFPTVDIILIISSLILTGLASHFKEGELPDNLGFKLLQIMQLLVLLCLWAASFIPLHVCRGISNWVVWPFASAAFCIIVLPWVAVFQQTEVVIKCIKSVLKKVLRLLRNLSLPECIKAKFRKVLRKQTDPILPK